MAVSTENASAEIRGWIHENVTGRRDIPDDYPLIDNGVLTSLQTVELVMFMEDRFGVTIEDEEFSEENFGSMRAIAKLVASKTA
jgi:methoxymalonate biosynthesis acyl carrier protein